MAEINPRTLGVGMLRMAAEDKAIYPEFMNHVIDAQSNGQTPMTFEEWKKLRQLQVQAGSINRL